MLLTNIQMDNYSSSLEQFLNRRDIIGYAAARNIRTFNNESAEYIRRKEELLNKYGNDELDSNGNPTGRKFIKFDSPNMPDFKKEIELYASVEHDVKVFKIPYESVIDKLSGSEILDIDWMLEDSDSSRDCK